MPGDLTSHAAPLAALALYCSCIVLWVWSPTASKVLVLALNLVTAAGIIFYSATPLRHVFQDERLMAVVASEVAVLIIWLAAVSGVRPALVFSYVIFAIHFCVAVAWVLFSYNLIDTLT